MAEATCRRELELEIPAEEVSKATDKVAKELMRVARVPGFRPGKAPITLIKKRFAEEIKGEVLQSLVPETVEKAVAEQKLTTVSQPQVDKLDYNEGQAVKFRHRFFHGLWYKRLQHFALDLFRKTLLDQCDRSF